MDISKLSNEELMKIAGINIETFAEEVSKQTRIASSGESTVKVCNSAPILIPKSEIYGDFDLKQLIIKEVDFTPIKKYISDNHYSHCLGSGIFAALGFFYKDELVTAVVYGNPIGINVGTWLQAPSKTYAELVRLFSKDGLPKNTESYCLGQSFKWLKENKKELKYLISYADPTHGHTGYIYQATNWKYAGRQGGLDRIFFIDGKQVHRRTANATYGTSSVTKLKAILGDRMVVKVTYPKHIYLMCLGSKKECKDWYSKFSFKPYPKAVNNIVNQ